MTNVAHHQNLRKRLFKKLEPYPHNDPTKRLLDRFIFVIGALGPISTIPQVYKIFAHHSAAGVSIFSWSANAIFSIVWITYGIVHKERIIIFTYILWLIINTTVATGAIIYR